MRGKNVNKMLALLLIVSMAISFAAIGITFAAPTRIFVNPPEGTADVGSYFEVDIEVEGVTDLSMWEFFISYNTEVLELSEPDIVEGPFLSSVGDTIFAAVVFTAFGYAQVGCSLTTEVAASGSGIIASLAFMVVGNPPGVTDLDLYDTALYDIGFNSIDHTVEDGEFHMDVVAVFDFTPEAPIPNQTVWFDASASFCPDGTEIVDYLWYFDDGSGAVHTSGSLISWYYNDYCKNPYMVNLTVTDEKNRTTSQVKPLLMWRDIGAVEIWVTDFNWEEAFSYPDWSPVYPDDPHPGQGPFYDVLPAFGNYGTQTETFNATLEFFYPDGSPCPCDLVLYWDNPITLDADTPSSLYATWYPTDPDGYAYLPPGIYNMTFTLSPVPGERADLGNLANNIVTIMIEIKPVQQGIFWDGVGLPSSETNNCYLPLGIEKQVAPMGMKWNLTTTNSGLVDLNSTNIPGELTLAVYFKEIGGWILPNEVQCWKSNSPLSGFTSITVVNATHICEAEVLWYEKEDYQVKVLVKDFTLPFNVNDTIATFLYTRWPVRNMSAVKMQAVLWNDTDSDGVLDTDEWPLLSLDEWIDFHPYSTTQIAGTGKFWADPPIQAAHDAATGGNATIPGDTILIYPYLYYENVVVDKAYLTFKAVLPYTAEVIAFNSWGKTFDLNGNGTTIKWLNITGATTDYGINIDSYHNKILENMIYDNKDGIHETLSEDLIKGNVITDSSRYGIYASGDNIKIDENNITLSGDTGIYLDGCGGADGTIITGNLIQNSTNSGIDVRVGSEDTMIGPCNTIRYNDYGIRVRLGTANTTIHNNGIFNNTQYGVWKAGAAPVVDAAVNYWGHQDGPDDDPNTNPLGQGDKITDGVLYVPWLAEDHPTDMWAPVIKVDPPLVHKWVRDGGAKCDSFTVDIIIANITEPKMAGFQFNLTYCLSLHFDLINLTDYEIKLDGIFGECNYFYEVKQGPGWFFLTATAEDPDCTFSGTGVLATLTFHIVYDMCYIDPYEWKCDLDLTDTKVCDWGDEVENPDYFAIGVFDGKFILSASKPKLHLQGRQWQTDHIINITGSDAKYCTNFTVDVWLLNATKIYDYWFFLTWNSTLMNLIDYDISRCFLEGPYEVIYIEEGHSNGTDLETMPCFLGPAECGEWVYDCECGGWRLLLPNCTDWLYVYVEAKCWTPPASGDGVLMTLTFHLEDFVEQGFVWKKHQDVHVNTWLNFTCTKWGLSYKCCHGPGDIPACCIDINNVKVNVYPVPGDVTGDGKVNGKDLKDIADNFGSSANYDLNDDGKVDLLDLVEAAKRITI